MASREHSMRVGPVSVFALVVVLCLAVMAVLAATTAQASRAEAETQAQFTSSTYENDADAAEVMSQVDALLADFQQSGLSPSEAASALQSVLPAGSQVEGREVNMLFVAQGGRTLTVRLEVTDDLNYRLLEWSTGVQRDEQEQDSMLWTGQ